MDARRVWDAEKSIKCQKRIGIPGRGKERWSFVLLHTIRPPYIFYCYFCVSPLISLFPFFFWKELYAWHHAFPPHLFFCFVLYTGCHPHIPLLFSSKNLLSHVQKADYGSAGPKYLLSYVRILSCQVVLSYSRINTVLGRGTRGWR